MTRQVNCPRCGKPAIYAPSNAFRPFCSERCKLIDLGHWADGKYAIPVADSSDTDAEELEYGDANKSGDRHHDDEASGENPKLH